MQQTTNKKNVISKGVSTLDNFCKNSKTILPILMMLVLCSVSYGGHSILDLVDPTFNPDVVATAFGEKSVEQVQALPDGKILAFGSFNSYNGIPTGKLVRINADGSLDTTFNNQTVSSIGATSANAPMLLQSDGKIILKHPDIVADGQSPKQLIRLNADGTLDTSFNFTLVTGSSGVGIKLSDSLHRLIISGSIETPQGNRFLVRLNEDGSLDESFDFIYRAFGLAMQGDRLIICAEISGEEQIRRFNEDGSIDESFTPFDGTVYKIVVQSDNKILFERLAILRRLNEDGDADMSFQTSTINTNRFQLAPDGKIVFAKGGGTLLVSRLLPNGTEDTTFNQYTPLAFSSFTILPDGGIVIGDRSNDGIVLPPNNFVRLTIDGIPDPTFNPGGIGFQTILPGNISTIEPQANGKIILGGKFDVVNDIPRSKIVRLNADSSVDESFQINTSGSGNYFSLLRDVYQVRSQDDGKVVMTGEFNYFLNGVFKSNFVRLNSDGSIDTTFDLSHPIPDYSIVNGAGRNRFEIYNDGKLMVGTSRISKQQIAGPVKLNSEGTLDPSFNSTIYDQASPFYIDDLITQTDGKIIISGSQSSLGGPLFSFVARLNPDGSPDSTFTISEKPGRLKSTLLLLPSGKFLVSNYSIATSSSIVERRNVDGSIDNTFNSLEIEDGRVNALLSIPNGKIFVGGSFTVSLNGEQSKNLLQLDADGNFEPLTYNLNEEVLCLALDGDGRVLVGGGFTVIGANNNNLEIRSYVARLIDSNTKFDFDGDLKSDFGVFNSSTGVWNIINSQTNQAVSTRFGLSGDKISAADYDGDGRYDIAVFRPSNSVWYLLKSRDGFSAVEWGLAEDKPVAADYDGDGKADIAVWRPSNRVWYIRQSSDQQTFAVQFGLSDDIPLVDVDFDGDGAADIAVWRPSDGNFYWLESGSNYSFRVVHFGQSGDIPVVADYNGDGKTDLAVFRPTEGNWYQFLSSASNQYEFSVTNFGINGDEPVAADYDGDGKCDIAIRRGNVWHILQTSNGYTSKVFANADETAIASAQNQ